MASPIRTLIAEDDSPALDSLKRYIDDDPELEIVGACSDGREALAVAERENPDLLILDIFLPRLSGFDLAQSLSSPSPVIVFVTAASEYAARAFDLCAADYILKPFDEDRLSRAVMRAKQRFRRVVSPAHPAACPDRFAVRSGKRIVYLRACQIDWLESVGNYVSIHSGRNSYQVLGAICNWEAQLDPRQFRRIHRGTIVNLDRIRELRPTMSGNYRVFLDTGAELTLSRGYRAKQPELTSVVP